MSDIMEIIDERERPKKQKQKKQRQEEVEFGVSVINYLKKKRIIRVKTCCSGVQMFKNMQLAILFDMFLNPSFKMTSFANIA